MMVEDPNSLVEYGFRRVMVVVTCILCTLLGIIDATIVNVALDTMKGSLGVSLQEVAWVVTAYAIANVIVIPMTAWLSQQFGRRNYFMASIILFTVTSFLNGNATSLTEMIIFRFLQGLGGGAFLVTSQTIITEAFPVSKRGMAQAIYGMGVIVGPTLGPPLGGYIVDNISWPFIFYINIPLGVIATLLTLQYVRSPKYGTKRKASEVDWYGIALLVICVGLLQYVLQFGQELNWFGNTLILVFTIVSLFCGFFFIWRQMVAKYPIINLRVLRDSNLSIGTVLMFVLGFGLFGSTFVIPIFTQSIMGWSALQAGMILVPSSIMTGFMMPIIGQMLQKGIKAKYMVAAGFFLFFVYSFMMYYKITPATGTKEFFWPLIIRGAGLGLLFVPITTLALSNLRGQHIAEGASFIGMMQQLGGSFGIALITTFIARDAQKHRVNILAHLDPTRAVVQGRLHAMQEMFYSKGFVAKEAFRKALTALDGTVMKQVMILTYADAFLYLGILFLISIPFVMLINEKGMDLAGAKVAK